MHQKRKELMKMGKRRSERDPAVQAALDGLKAQVKADIKRQRGVAMSPQTPAAEMRPLATAAGPAVARFLAIAERHVARAPQRRPAGGGGMKGKEDEASEGDGGKPTNEQRRLGGERPD